MTGRTILKDVQMTVKANKPRTGSVLGEAQLQRLNVSYVVTENENLMRHVMTTLMIQMAVFKTAWVTTQLGFALTMITI